LVRRCEWLMFMPNDGFLPQMSHTAPMTLRTPFEGRSDKSQRLASTT
jgi:hypothetical protein